MNPEYEMQDTGRTRVAISDRFGPLIERHDGADFPYYNGLPVRITGLQWTFVMFMTALGFVALVFSGALFSGPIGGFVPAILFVALPLAGLILVAQGYWTAIFRRVTARDVLVMFGFAFLNLVVTLSVGALVSWLFGANANPEGQALANGSAVDWITFYPRTAIQLLGEELLTILPFLALMYFFVSQMNLSRKMALVVAWVATAVIFGLIHLPTYGWNLVQVLLVISTARIVLTLAYIRTKNIWVSTGAHIINDYVLLTASNLLGLAATSGLMGIVAASG